MKRSLKTYALAVVAMAVTGIAAQLASASVSTSASASASASPSAPATHRQCYLPGGLKSGDIPCDPNAEHSMCCKDANHCLSNGLCLDVDDATPNQGIMYVRGTCTDENWNSPYCPQHCRYNPEIEKNATAKDFRIGGVMVYGCNRQGYGGPAAYCCETVQIPLECCRPTAMFSLPGASLGPALTAQTYPPAGADSPATLSSPPTGMITSSPTAASGYPSVNPAASTTAVSGAGASESGGGMSEGTKIGLGLGLGIGISIILIGLAFLYFYRRAHPAKPGQSANTGEGEEGNHRSNSVLSLTSGTTAAGHGGTADGVWVDGRFYPGAHSVRQGPGGELEAGGSVLYAKELDAKRNFKELEGSEMAREIATWEHTPAELPVGNSPAGWGQWDQSATVTSEKGFKREPEGGDSPVVSVQRVGGDVSPLSPAPAKVVSNSSTVVGVTPAEQTPQGGFESRWEGVTGKRLAQD